MCRKLRTTVPITRDLRKPKVPDHSVVKKLAKREKQRQTANFNTHHGARELPTLLPGDTVYVRDRDSAGIVLQETAPRSYDVQTPHGMVRRKHLHMVRSPQNEQLITESDTDTEPQSDTNTSVTNNRLYSTEEWQTSWHTRTARQ